MKIKSVEKFDNINSIMLKEKSYLNIAKKFCEIEMEKSEQAADLYVLLIDLCNIHEELLDKVDEAFIEFECLFDPK
ncbi:MAG: hypothetical protein II085_02335 [Alphaproteobacteria bacterium]|nr:hypothetical protein [Alphaproteobacteria bacterium]